MMLGEGSSSSKKANIMENSMTALVVDDDSTVCKIHSMILKSLGFKVEVVENGKEAVDLFRAGSNFDIVFTDMEMPVMNGIQATKEMRAMGVKSKIVGVTSRCSDGVIDEFMKAGLDHCYAKPLKKDMIHHLVEELKKK